MSTPPSQTSTLEPGSFRDPESRVFYAGDSVYRALSREGLEDFEALAATGLLEDERIVRTERVEEDGLPGLLTKETAGVLRHELIPFVSYPYEWTFSMLRDAALLQLDLLLASLDEDLILKDSSPYNVQFEGARARFVDVGSFERMREGEPWVGYRQFCMLYLYPLLLQAVKGVPFQPWLRGSIDGITPAQMRALLSFRDRFRRGLFLNVFAHARLEERYAAKGGQVKEDVKRAGFRKELIVANARKMRKLVERLEWNPPQGVWVQYGERNSYTDEDARRKDEFVREVATSRRWGLAWDIGCNNGRYSRIAAEGADYVVAVDADQGPVELLYRELRDEGERRILPLTMNLADPSPGLGWRGLERKAMPDRGRPDLVLALALIHHLAISANVPVKELVGWLASLGCSLVIEFPTRDDPMVKTLLAPKRDGLHPDYELGFFERCLSKAFEVERTERLESGTRILYFARPKRA
jgi:SAM-dependent methyltransferase